ncbi:MAG TPA: STN domain-containing protein, partial [Planctomycetota bacterium]|nr:STN domain-containing protein [Planctomycetota bacterium]
MCNYGLPARLLIAIAIGVLAWRVAVAAEPVRATIDLKAVPLAEALNRLQDASGLHLAFSTDLVKDAEPVTLSAKDEPVDAVLLRILRPRGLECIYTGKTMAAIVRADSNMGMAKAAGRAMRTFARLARKLEGAVQEGDEVKVPGWVEEDDRALAEAYVELNCVMDHFARGARRQKGSISKEDIDDAQRALECFDPDVRIGMTSSSAYFHLKDVRTADALAEMAAHPDPLVRAAAVIIKAGWRPYESWFSTDLCQAAAEGDPDALVPGRPVS